MVICQEINFKNVPLEVCKSYKPIKLNLENRYIEF